MKKYLTILIFFLLLFLFSFTLLRADNFHVTEDYADSEIFVTTLFSIEELAIDENEIYTIEYDENAVVGNYSNSLVYESWSDYVDIVGSRYRRKKGVNDNLWIPGNSRIDVSALIRNENSYDVKLRDWKFFTSRSNSVMGNFETFGVEGIYGHYFYNFFGNSLLKNGNFLSSPLVVDVNGGEEKLIKLMSLNIFQPLQVEYFNWTPNILENGDLVIDFELKLKSLALFRLKSVEFVHGNFSHTRDFWFEDEHIYEYQLNYGDSYGYGLNIFDSFKIKKPIPKSVCLVLGSHDLFSPFGDTRTLVYERSHPDGGEDWFGRNVDVDWYPGQEAMCVTLMGYSLVGKELKYEIPIPVDIEANFLNDSKTLGIGEELILDLEVVNSGMDLDSLALDLNFDTDFQFVKNSNCEFLNFDSGILLNTGVLNSGDVFSCSIVFEILDYENVLFLKNTLSFEDEVLDSLVFKYIPDVEMSFEYDYELSEFVFESSVGDISSIVLTERMQNETICKKVSFFGLEDEVCI